MEDKNNYGVGTDMVPFGGIVEELPFHMDSEGCKQFRITYLYELFVEVRC